MPSPEVMVVVCRPLSAGPPRLPSGDAKCSACDQPVWVANSTVALVQEIALKTVIVCDECAYTLPRSPDAQVEA